jgi:transitional endoplasmic reticulum ATPase
VIFFDEIDSIAPQRSAVSDTHVSERVVSQILTELDGVEELKDVIIVAATNRPDMVDPALLRPGRFDRLIYIKPPDRASREKIFAIHTKGKPLADDIKLSELADITEGYVGADIEGICREAAMLALREIVTPGIGRKDIEEKAGSVKISKKHFERAVRRVKPTTSRETLKAYEQSAELFAKYATELEEAELEEEVSGFVEEQEKEPEHKNVPGFSPAE